MASVAVGATSVFLVFEATRSDRWFAHSFSSTDEPAARETHISNAVADAEQDHQPKPIASEFDSGEHEAVVSSSSTEGAAISVNYLLESIYRHDVDSLRRYLDSGGDPNVRVVRDGVDSGSLLEVSVDEPDRIEFVKLLKSYGVTADIPALKHALGRGNNQALLVLKDDILKLDAKSKNELLAEAASYSYKGYLEVVKMLVDSGARPEAVSGRKLEGDYDCSVSPLSAVTRAKNNEYALDAQVIREYLFKEAVTNTGKSVKTLEAEFTNNPDYNCDLE